MADKSTKFGMEPRSDLSIDFSLKSKKVKRAPRLKSIERSKRGCTPNLVLLSAM